MNYYAIEIQGKVAVTAPRDELEPAILAVLDDPNHDGI
jgi:hypothetical protein